MQSILLMPLKDDLLRVGYLPDNLPPTFGTGDIADFFIQNEPRSYLSQSRNPVRPAAYNASKRGLTRRTFSVAHPVTGYDLAEFVSVRWDQIIEFQNQSSFSMSIPSHTDDSDRALRISSHSEVENIRLERLSHYRFIANTDISRFYHSIYTHSLPWAYHGKLAAKADRNVRSADIFFNRADFVLRNGQDGQTIGIPVGPDTSRVFAETISTAIDVEFQQRCDVSDYAVLRHVDDVWIGTNSHADAERVLSRYRESIREFELDINESKTRIYSADFRFADGWPTEIAAQLDFASGSTSRQIPDRLRAALEHAFSFAVSHSDDGVLKYTIRYLDQSGLQREYWSIIEPFLKRSVVHFGHTVDYVVRVIVWRHLIYEDLDIPTWTTILNTILDQHGRLGNDSEVCWGIYACMRLNIPVPRDVGISIVHNCGALSVLALLNCVDLGLIDTEIFSHARDQIAQESAAGPYWPVVLEWIGRSWPNHGNITIGHDLIEEMSGEGVSIFDHDRLPPVFRDVDEGNFGTVSAAIERRSNMYDDDSEDDAEEFGLDF